MPRASDEIEGRPQLALFAIENLDVGVLIVKRDFMRLRFANAGARAALEAFGSATELPPRLRAVIEEKLLAEADAVPKHFTPPVPITAPDGRRFFVRARRLPCKHGCILATIAMATVRESDVKRVLADQFGLSLQEMRVGFLAAQGYRNKEIAERLKIVEGTVKNYLTRVFLALAVQNRTELSATLHRLADEQADVATRGA